MNTLSPRRVNQRWRKLKHRTTKLLTVEKYPSPASRILRRKRNCSVRLLSRDIILAGRIKNGAAATYKVFHGDGSRI